MRARAEFAQPWCAVARMRGIVLMETSNLSRQVERVELEYLAAENLFERLPDLIAKKRRSENEFDPARRRRDELAEVLKTMRWLERHEATIREFMKSRGIAG